MNIRKATLWILGAASVATAIPASAQQATGFDRVKFVQAVEDEDGGTVRQLLDKYGKPILNAENMSGDTALTVSIRKRSDWAYFFLSSGANPDQPGKDGDTPLIVAARVGYAGAAEQLLARKADVNRRNRRGETPLITAVQARQAAMVKLLLENGADPDLKDNFGGRSAREYAKQNTRDRDLLTLVESTAPKPAKVENANDFKL